MDESRGARFTRTTLVRDKQSEVTMGHLETMDTGTGQSPGHGELVAMHEILKGESVGMHEAGQ